MKLLGAPASPFVRKVRILALELGIKKRGRYMQFTYAIGF